MCWACVGPASFSALLPFPFAGDIVLLNLQLPPLLLMHGLLCASFYTSLSSSSSLCAGLVIRLLFLLLPLLPSHSAGPLVLLLLLPSSSNSPCSRTTSPSISLYSFFQFFPLLRSVCWSVGRSVSHNFQEKTEVGIYKRK